MFSSLFNHPGLAPSSYRRFYIRQRASNVPCAAVASSAAFQRNAAVSFSVIILLKLISAIDSPTNMYSLPNLRNLNPSIVLISSCVYKSSINFPSPCSTYVSPSIRTNRCNTYVRLPHRFSASASTISPRSGARSNCFNITLSRSPSINGRILTPEGEKRTSLPDANNRAISGINISFSTRTTNPNHLANTRSNCTTQYATGTYEHKTARSNPY